MDKFDLILSLIFETCIWYILQLMKAFTGLQYSVNYHKQNKEIQTQMLLIIFLQKLKHIAQVGYNDHSILTLLQPRGNTVQLVLKLVCDSAYAAEIKFKLAAGNSTLTVSWNLYNCPNFMEELNQILEQPTSAEICYHRYQSLLISYLICIYRSCSQYRNVT